MFKLLVGLLEQGLIAWNSHERTKYLDKLIKLKGEWNEEYNKPLSIRSDMRLDDIESELRVLAESFVQAAGAANA